jgi:hypothetical protein
VDNSRIEHLRMIQGVITRLSQNSFQLKGWAVTIAVALQVFLKGEATPAFLFVPALPVLAFWLLDSLYLRRERVFRCLFDQVRQAPGPADFSMDARAFDNTAPSLLRTAFAPTIIGFYGPFLLALMVLSFSLRNR